MKDTIVFIIAVVIVIAAWVNYAHLRTQLMAVQQQLNTIQLYLSQEYSCLDTTIKHKAPLRQKYAR